MTAPAITVRGLCKDYGDLHAVVGLSFEVAAGEIFALLGPNGAGKTTTIEILEGFRERTAGEVRVLGFDPGRGGRAYRERIGIMLQSGGIDAELTVVETMRLYAGLYHRPRDIDETIDVVDLRAKRSARVRTLSGGHAPAPRARAGPDRRPERRFPRRTDDGTRPERPPRRVGHDRAAAPSSARPCC